MFGFFNPRTAPTRTFTLAVGVCLLAFGGLVYCADPAAADDIEPGLDLFTSPGPNFFPVNVPAGFFGPGSLAVNEPGFPFVGEPLTQFAGDPIGSADTIVVRTSGSPMGALVCQDPPIQVSIPIELVALNLVGSQPITVNFQGGGTELWSVRACVSYNSPSTGTLDVTQVCDEGGVFDSTLTVNPRLIFTRLSDGQTEVMDPGPAKTLTVEMENWVHSPGAVDARVVGPGLQVDGNCNGMGDDPTLMESTTSFFPGIEEVPCDECDDPAPSRTQVVPVPHSDGDPPIAQHQVSPLLFSIAIPTVSQRGLLLIALLLALAGAWVLYRRRRVEG